MIQLQRLPRHRAICTTIVERTLTVSDVKAVHGKARVGVGKTSRSAGRQPEHQQPIKTVAAVLPKQEASTLPP